MKPWIAAVVLLPAVAGAAPRALSLQDALALALRHNPTLASARVAVVDAQGRELAARGAYEPTLELTASAQDARNDPRISLFPQDLHHDQVVAQATITRPFLDGSRLALRVEAIAGRATTRIPVGDAVSDTTLDTVTPKL